MLRRENVRPLGMNFSVANSDLICAIHQLRDEIKIEAGAAKRRYLSLRSNDYMRIFDSVVEVVFRHAAVGYRVCGCFQNSACAHCKERPQTLSGSVET